MSARLALFADIHANLEAISACLDHARALGAERFAFLGDLVGYGADPVAVLDLIQRHADDGAIVVLGNHDAAALGRDIDELNPNAQAAIRWTRTQLGSRHCDFLSSLPLSVREGDALFVHASAVTPEQWIYVTDARQADASMSAAMAGHVFSGHVHEPCLYFPGAGGQALQFIPAPGTPIPTSNYQHWLAIVGSAGQPRDGNNKACYALFDGDRERVTFFRVAYDHDTAARKVRNAGLPERLAQRLERGD